MRGFWWLALTAGLTACGSGGGSGGDGDGQGGDGQDGPSEISSTPEPPTMTSAQMLASGRRGTDLRLAVVGHDANADAVSLWVKFLDANGNPVPYWDSDYDGVADSAENTLALSAADGSLKFDTALTFSRFVLDRSAAVQAEMALVDRANTRSATQRVQLKRLAEKKLGETCDKTYVADRCLAGLGCKGEPATCKEGEAPTVSATTLYARGTLGPRVLIEGTDPDDDVAWVTLNFFTLAGAPVNVDFDGDGVADSSTFEVDAGGSNTRGKFFVELQASVGFDNTVQKVTIQPRDDAGKTSALYSATLKNAPGRSAGQSCDPRGFNACVTDTVCVPTGTSNVCTVAASYRTKMVAAAPAITVGPTIQTVKGKATGASLFDPPAGCASNDPSYRPEGLVRLKLSAPAATLTLTTARPATNFDTVLYLLPGANPAPGLVTATGCNDDLPKSSLSTLVLSNVPAGDYVVVVDSFGADGGDWELAVSAQ